MILYSDCALIEDKMISRCDDCSRFEPCKREHDKERNESPDGYDETDKT